MKPSGTPDAFPPVEGPLDLPFGAQLLGHQGGWDEILMVVGPLAVVGLLLWVANKRVAAQLEEQATGTGDRPNGRGDDA
jgi:hypothetical protein